MWLLKNLIEIAYTDDVLEVYVQLLKKMVALLALFRFAMLIRQFSSYIQIRFLVIVVFKKPADVQQSSTLFVSLSMIQPPEM